MSVYLSRSPYLTSYRAGGVRANPFRKKNKRRAGRPWDGGSFMVASRPRRSSGRSKGVFALFGRQTKQSLAIGAHKTGETVRKSAETFSQLAHAVKNGRGGKKVHFDIGPNVVIGGLLVMVVLLSTAYLAFFTQAATKGYELRRLEADRQQLLTQYEVKNMKLAQAQSLNNIIQSDKANTMHRTSLIEFVKGPMVLASR